MGFLYRHYRTQGIYEQICEAASADLASVIVYRPVEDPGSIWVRTKSVFHEMVEGYNGAEPRFRRVGDQPDQPFKATAYRSRLDDTLVYRCFDARFEVDLTPAVVWRLGHGDDGFHVTPAVAFFATHEQVVPLSEQDFNDIVQSLNEPPSPPTPAMLAAQERYESLLAARLGASDDSPQSVTPSEAGDGRKRWIVQMQKDDDDFILPLPEDLAAALDMKEGETFELAEVEGSDGRTWILRKARTSTDA